MGKDVKPLVTEQLAEQTSCDMRTTTHGQPCFRQTHDGALSPDPVDGVSSHNIHVRKDERV